MYVCLILGQGLTGRARAKRVGRVMGGLARRCSMLQCNVQLKVVHCCNAWGIEVGFGSRVVCKLLGGSPFSREVHAC